MVGETALTPTKIESPPQAPGIETEMVAVTPVGTSEMATVMAETLVAHSKMVLVISCGMTDRGETVLPIVLALFREGYGFMLDMED